MGFQVQNLTRDIKLSVGAYPELTNGVGAHTYIMHEKHVAHVGL
jgi:hypothetical protein